MSTKNVKVTKIADLTDAQREAIKAGIAANTDLTVLSDELNVALPLIRKQKVLLEQQAQLAAVNNSEATGQGAEVQALVVPGSDEGKGTAAGKLDAKTAMLNKLKESMPQVEIAGPTATKASKPRAKKNPKDATKRDVVIVSSQSEKLAWITGNIDYMNESDASVLNKINKFAVTRQKVKDDLLALTAADDVKVERVSGVEAEGHEAVMAANFDTLSTEEYRLIGRRPKGFAAAPAPRKAKAKEETLEDIDQALEKLKAKQAQLLAKSEKVEATEPVENAENAENVEASADLEAQ